MKQLTTGLTIIAVTLLFFSCKKEVDQKMAPATVSAVGYWKAAFHVGGAIFHLLNRPDGSSRIYVIVNNPDTANADSKVDGHYTLTEDVFRSHYDDAGGFVDIYASLNTRNYMTGIFLFNNTGGTTFEAFKQQ